MRHLAMAFAATLLCAACVDGRYPCAVDSDCPRGASCDAAEKRCVITGGCDHLCATNELCQNKVCVVQAPGISAVAAPATWSSRAKTVTVTAVADGTGGPGIASAALQIAGQADIAGTTSDTGLVRLYTFAVPGAVQAPGSETPVDFTIVATDTTGRTTPAAAVGHGQLLIDDLGPSVPGVTINGGVSVQGIKWFKAGAGTIDAQVAIQDAGSGVDPASLTLVTGATRLDQGAPACAPGASAQALTCHFSIPQSFGAAGHPQRSHFSVVGSDRAGNAVRANTAAVGIDGKPPQVTFTVGPATAAPAPTTKYPALNSGCGAPQDGTLFCGHDGLHFWRNGESASARITFTASDSFAAPDDTGSGVDPNGGACVIAGSPTCTTTFDAATGAFSFPANFAAATFKSNPDGTGTVTVTVNAADLVGNISTTAVSVPVAVTRVKWVRQLSGVNNLVGAPVLSESNKLLIVAGNSPSADPIVSVMTDGSLGTFKFGAGKAISVTSNMALDSTPSTDPAHPTPVLYLNTGPTLYSIRMSDPTQFCTAKPSANDLVGSPIIFGGGSNGQVVVAAGNTIGAFFPSFDASHACAGNGSSVFNNATLPPPKLGPPASNGNLVYLGYDNTTNTAGDRGIKSVAFNGSVFGTQSGANISRQPTKSGGPAAVTPTSELFFGDDFSHQFYDYTTAFIANSASPVLTAVIFAQPTVSGSLVFGASDQLIAYDKANISTIAWTALVGSTQVTPPAVGAGVLYASEAANKLMHAIDSGTRVDQWTYGGSATTNPITTLSSITTEPTLGGDGTLYFGDSGGKVFAIITDTPPAATGTSDWPRTGYDNCNSNHANNPGFTCQ